MPDPAKIQPRLMTKAQAAAYCELCPEQFSNWIKAGRIPGPIPDTHRWDRHAIDLALDKLSGIASESEPSAFDAWKAGRNARAA